jgi:hypothetical protein
VKFLKAIFQYEIFSEIDITTAVNSGQIEINQNFWLKSKEFLWASDPILQRISTRMILAGIICAQIALKNIIILSITCMISRENQGFTSKVWKKFPECH